MKIRTIQWIGIAFFSVACVKEINDLNIIPITPGIAVPVGQFTISADKLTKVGDSLFVQEGDQGVVELYYETQVLSTTLSDRLSISDQSFNETLPFSSFVFMGGVDNQVKVSKYNTFTILNSDLPSPAPQLERVIFKSGTLNISQSKDFDHQLQTSISFPTFIKDGNPITIVLNDNDSFSGSLDLADLDLTGVSGTEFNTLDYQISAVVTNTGSDTQGSISINFSLQNMQFSFMKGDFKTYTLDDVGYTFDVGLPQSEITNSNISFTNPSVEIAVINSAGIPLGLDINEFSATMEDGTVTQITGTYDDNTFVVLSPASPGESAESSYLIDKNNTDNLISLLNEIPNSVYFKGVVSANPNGAPVEGNFLTDSSEVTVNAKMVLPFEGYVNDYVLADTINASLDIDSNGAVSLENINVRLQVENNFPVGIGLQLYFLDSLDNSIILDSLFFTKEEQQIFPSAQVDNTGIVTAPTIQTNDISMDKEKYERIRYAGSIRLVATLATPGASDTPSKSIKITSNNYFSLGIGLSAQAYIDPNAINN